MKPILNLSYYVGFGWVKPGLEGEYKSGETEHEALDRLFVVLDSWVKSRFPDAQLSCEEEIPTIQLRGNA